MKITPTAFAILLSLLPAMAADSVDLSGEWEFHLPSQKEFANESPGKIDFTDRIHLPGMVTAQGFGEIPSMRTRWTGGDWSHPELFTAYQKDGNFKFPFFLQPPRYHVGPAWFRKQVEIPSDWQGDSAVLFLERPHWNSTVWIDGVEAGGGEALGTPHEIDLGKVTPGIHTLTLRIDNRLSPVNPGESAHSVTDHTQGNWNGVVGRIELQRQPPNHLEAITVRPKVTGELKVDVTGATVEAGRLVVTIRKSATGDLVASGGVEISGSGAFEESLDLRTSTPPELWDEFSPTLYQAEVVLEKAGKEVDRETRDFGFREVASADGVFTLNGHPLSLRGTLDCAIFPRTGHPPTDVDSWRKIMRVCKEYGLNHIRFHSWCPPEAAFRAADEAGIYFQVEVSTWSNGDALLGSGLPLDAWLEREMARMIRVYGNHPSFMLLAHGNEPHGPKHAAWLKDFVARWKARDPRVLYTTGAGWTVQPGSDFDSIAKPRLQQWGEGLRSRLNALPPSTDFDWSAVVKKHPKAPVVSHEIGQWCSYPDFGMITKCDGFFQARNYEVFRDEAEKHGLLGRAERFFHDAGKLQVLAYKHDIEAALRTRGQGGFQLLGLQDFPGQGTALVGVVDFFWDPKSYVTPAEFRRFCGPTVPLARLPKMVFTTAESLKAELELYHFSPRHLDGFTPVWSLTDGDKKIAGGQLSARYIRPFGLHQLGAIEVPLGKVSAPAKLVLTVGGVGETFSNQWEIFVYPPKVAVPAPEGVVTRDWTEAKSALAAGKNVFWMPLANEIGDDTAHPLLMGFSPIFWNTAYTNWQPPHTLGISVDPLHPAFSGFPTDSYSNWQWWEIQQGARPFILTDFPKLQPVVEVIDDWFTARRLGLVFEAKVGTGKLLACGINLEGDLGKRPVARQFKASLMRYFNGPDFAPKAEMTEDEVASLIKQAPLAQRLGVTAEADSEEPGHLVDALFDGDIGTLWHTAFTKEKPGFPHQVRMQFPREIDLTALLLTQRQDGSANGQVSEIEVLDGGGKSLVRAKVPAKAVGHRVALPVGTKTKQLTVRFLNGRGGPFASLAELDAVQP